MEYFIRTIVHFFASQDDLEVMRVTHSLTYSLTHLALALNLLMWPWWVMIPIEDLTDVTQAIEDTDEDEEEDEEDFDWCDPGEWWYLLKTWLMLLL